jgi:hypothetical protein
MENGQEKLKAFKWEFLGAVLFNTVNFDASMYVCMYMRVGVNVVQKDARIFCVHVWK